MVNTTKHNGNRANEIWSRVPLCDPQYSMTCLVSSWNLNFPSPAATAADGRWWTFIVCCCCTNTTVNLTVFLLITYCDICPLIMFRTGNISTIIYYQIMITNIFQSPILRGAGIIFHKDDKNVEDVIIDFTMRSI